MSYIKKFSEFINESIWSDIQDRSMGKTVRREDDINLMSEEDICDYMINMYPKYRNPTHHSALKYRLFPTKDILKPSTDGFSMQIVTNVDFVISNIRGQQYECFLYFDKGFPEEKKRGYLDAITDICSLEKDNVEGFKCFKVSPLDSEVLTLDFCVNVIDRIIEIDPDEAYYIKDRNKKKSEI